MQFTKEQLDKFKRIYKEEYNEDISDSQALEMATNLITLLKIVYQPMTETEYNQLQESRKADK
jgi:hypothetical protein